MPYVLHPFAALPPSVDEAYVLMHSPDRIVIVTWLAAHPASLVGAIVEGVGSQRISLRSHLDALEAIGVVTADRPVGQRQRMRVRYSADGERVNELVERMAEYIRNAFDGKQLGPTL